MKRTAHLVFGIGAICLAVAAVVWAFSPHVGVRADGHAGTTSDGKIAGSLDGMTFIARMGPSGKPADVEDSLTFSDGMFVSAECVRRCGYPPAPYYTRRVGAGTEFVAESTCVENDATMSWRGTIEDDKISGLVVWTAERWYRTIEKSFWFEGRIADGSRPVARND